MAEKNNNSKSENSDSRPISFVSQPTDGKLYAIRPGNLAPHRYLPD